MWGALLLLNDSQCLSVTSVGCSGAPSSTKPASPHRAGGGREPHCSGQEQEGLQEGSSPVTLAGSPRAAWGQVCAAEPWPARVTWARCRQVCGKSFNRMYNLLGHMHLHAGSKPFKCPYCSSKFNLKGNLSRHMKVKHGVMDISLDSQGGSPARAGHRDCPAAPEPGRAVLAGAGSLCSPRGCPTDGPDAAGLWLPGCFGLQAQGGGSCWPQPSPQVPHGVSLC